MKKLLALGLLMALCMVVGPVLAASITTDRPDYVPEETVIIYGTGFGYNDPVSIVVTRPDGSTPLEYPVTPNPVNPDVSGAFTATYQLDGIQGTYTINAVSDGGISAEWTFTDAAAANIEFKTSGLPVGTSVDVTWSGTVNGGVIKTDQTATVISPGPTTQGLQQGSSVTFSFPLTVIVGTTTYTLQGTDISSPHIMPTSSPPVPATTVTATYSAPTDTTAPTTSIDLSGTAGNNSWYRSDVVVTLTATDNAGGSGVKEIHYILDSGTEQTVAGASAIFTISTDGTHSLEYWAVDNSDNVETSHNTATIKIDKTAPVFDTFVVPTGWVILNQPDVEVTWTAHDATSGLDTSNPTSPIIIDTSTVGTKTGSVTLYDVAGNSVLHSYSVSVGYNMLGFLQPINMDGSSIFKQGSTVPTKFQLTDYFGNYVSNAVARLTNVKFTSVPVGDELEAVSTSAATTGNLFRYDTTSNQYIFNLGTKSLEKGGYRITATLDSGQTIQVVISLK